MKNMTMRTMQSSASTAPAIIPEKRRETRKQGDIRSI